MDVYNGAHDSVVFSLEAEDLRLYLVVGQKEATWHFIRPSTLDRGSGALDSLGIFEALTHVYGVAVQDDETGS